MFCPYDMVQLQDVPQMVQGSSREDQHVFFLLVKQNFQQFEYFNFSLTDLNPLNFLVKQFGSSTRIYSFLGSSDCFRELFYGSGYSRYKTGYLPMRFHVRFFFSCNKKENISGIFFSLSPLFTFGMCKEDPDFFILSLDADSVSFQHQGCGSNPTQLLDPFFHSY